MKFENISVIIPTFNRKGYLEKCVNSLINQDYAGMHEIIIIDDGSNDGTKDEIAKIKKNSDVKISYYYQLNSGVSKARNNGVKKARFNYILFIDDDCFVDNDFLDKLNNRIRRTKYKECFLVQVNLKNPDKNNDFSVIHEYLFNEKVKFELKKNGGKYVDILGGVFATNKKYIKKYLFDEDFANAREDYDLRKRLGRKIIFAEELKVYHYSRTNLFDSIKQKFGYGVGNALVFKKWGNQEKEQSDFNGRLITSFKYLWKHFGLKSIKFKLIFIIYVISTIAGENYGKIKFKRKRFIFKK